MDGQVVNEVEISTSGNGDEDVPNKEPDVNEAYAYKKKKKSTDNFEQQVVDLLKNEASHDDTDYFCHSLAKQFKSFDAQQKACAKVHISQIMFEVQYPMYHPTTMPAGNFNFQEVQQGPPVQQVQEVAEGHVLHEM